MRQPVPLRIFQNPDAAARERDTSRPVMLIGFQNQGNLGLGYLAAVLRRYGYPVRVVDIEQEPEEILRIAKEINPVLIGFSLCVHRNRILSESSGTFAAQLHFWKEYMDAKENGYKTRSSHRGHFQRVRWSEHVHALACRQKKDTGNPIDHC